MSSQKNGPPAAAQTANHKQLKKEPHIVTLSADGDLDTFGIGWQEMTDPTDEEIERDMISRGAS